jgi:hypothetical protein
MQSALRAEHGTGVAFEAGLTMIPACAIAIAVWAVHLPALTPDGNLRVPQAA